MFIEKMTKNYERSIDENKANLTVGLRRCNCWKNNPTVPLQALPFLDTEVYPVLQMMGMANVAHPKGVVSYVETTEKANKAFTTLRLSK